MNTEDYCRILLIFPFHWLIIIIGCTAVDRMPAWCSYLTSFFLPTEFNSIFPSAMKKSIESQRWPFFALHFVLASTAIVTSIQYSIQKTTFKYKRIDFVCSCCIRSCIDCRGIIQEKPFFECDTSEKRNANHFEDEDGHTQWMEQRVA